MSRMKLWGVVVMMLLAGLWADATPQVSEKISYNGRIFTMNSTPLETYFTKDNPKPPMHHSSPDQPYEKGKLPTVVYSTACYRGYVGTWKIEDSFLWLVSLSNVKEEPLTPSVVNKDWTFPVKATWYTGNLLVDSKIIQVKEGKIIGEHEADMEHPLAFRMEVESLTVKNITSAAISKTTGDKPGEYKIIPQEELEGLLKTMATGRKAGPRDYKEDKKDGYYIMLEGGTVSNGNTGGVMFNIRDDGNGTYMVNFFGNNFESTELAKLAKRIYDSPRSVPATMGKDGLFKPKEEQKP